MGANTGRAVHTGLRTLDNYAGLYVEGELRIKGADGSTESWEIDKITVPADKKNPRGQNILETR